MACPPKNMPPETPCDAMLIFGQIWLKNLHFEAKKIFGGSTTIAGIFF